MIKVRANNKGVRLGIEGHIGMMGGFLPSLPYDNYLKSLQIHKKEVIARTTARSRVLPIKGCGSLLCKHYTDRQMDSGVKHVGSISPVTEKGPFFSRVTFDICSSVCLVTQSGGYVCCANCKRARRFSNRLA